MSSFIVKDPHFFCHLTWMEPSASLVKKSEKIVNRINIEDDEDQVSDEEPKNMTKQIFGGKN